MRFFFIFIFATAFHSASAEVYQNKKFGVLFHVPKGFVVSEQIVKVPKPENGGNLPMGVPVSFQTIRISDKNSKSKDIKESITLLVEHGFMFELARMALRARKDLHFKTQAVKIGPWVTEKWPYYPGPFGFTAFVYTIPDAIGSKEVGIFGPQKKQFEEAAQLVLKTLSTLE